MMKSLLALLLSVAALAAVMSTADAQGRVGSHRVGGYNSHGKGSHYVGGHRAFHLFGHTGCICSEIIADLAAARMISGRQIREARAMLRWDVADLEQRAGVDAGKIRRAENADGTPSITLHQAGLIQQAFERARIKFGQNGAVMRVALEESRGAPGDGA